MQCWWRPGPGLRNTAVDHQSNNIQSALSLCEYLSASVCVYVFGCVTLTVPAALCFADVHEQNNPNKKADAGTV